jgi:hypothetical protein
MTSGKVLAGESWGMDSLESDMIGVINGSQNGRIWWWEPNIVSEIYIQLLGAICEREDVCWYNKN